MNRLNTKMKLAILLIVITLFTMVGCATTKVNDIFRFEARQLTLTVGETVDLKMIMGNIDSNEKIVFDISEDDVVKLSGIKSTYIHGDTVIGDCYAMKVRAISEGAIKLTAYLKSNPNVRDTIDIVVSNERIGQMTITSDDLVLEDGVYTMEIGDVAHLKANVLPADLNNEVNWTSLNESIATVDKYGNVTAKFGGVATIMASSKHDSTMNCKIDIHVNYLCTEKVIVNGPTLVQIGEVVKYDVILEPFGADSSSLTWSVSYVKDLANPDLSGDGTINASGQFSATVAGEYIIVASVKTYVKDANGEYITVGGVKKQENKRGTINVVVENVPATEISIKQQSVEMYADETVKLNATVKPTNAKQMPTWISSDEAIVKVDAEGNLQGVAPGVATIKALDEKSGLFAEITVKINARPDATNIKVYDDGKEVTEILRFPDQGKFQLTAKVEPENANAKYTIEISDSNVATVNSSGLVTIVGVGNAIITVTSADGKVTKEIPLTIAERPAAVTGFDVYYSANGSEAQKVTGKIELVLDDDYEGTIIINTQPFGALTGFVITCSDLTKLDLLYDEVDSADTIEVLALPVDTGSGKITISNADGSVKLEIEFVVK